jgi:phospholipid transport system substrate-binding protein
MGADRTMSADRMALRIVRATMVVLALMAPVAAATAAQAQTADDARALVKNMAEKALKVLADKSISQAQREAEFAVLFKQNFHIRTIGVFVLGRYWRRATPEQRKAYLKVFERLIVKTYTVRLSQYAGEKFVIRGANGPDGGAYTVDSVVLREGRPPIPLRWAIRKSRSGLKIVDVVIENLSMAQTQRDDFAAILRQRGSIDGLIKALHEKMDALDKS